MQSGGISRDEVWAAVAVLVIVGGAMAAALLLAYAVSPTVSVTPTAPHTATHVPSEAAVDSGPPIIILPTLTATVTPLPVTPSASPVAPTATVAPPATAVVKVSATPPPITNTAAPTVTTCAPPSGWVQGYTVRSGDTLYTVGLRYGVTGDALRVANCLVGDRILAGQLLWVPAQAPVDTSTPTAQPTLPPPIDPTQAVIADPCSNPLANIASPRYGTRVDGPFWLTGTADIPNFLRYEIDVRRDGNSTWMHLGSDRTRVADGQLARVNPARFGSGAFWVRLTVVDNTYNYPPRCVVLIYFP